MYTLLKRLLAKLSHFLPLTDEQRFFHAICVNEFDANHPLADGCVRCAGNGRMRCNHHKLATIVRCYAN
jgi:hypothetical protein